MLTPDPPSAHHLIFVRHGATEFNLAGLRCGGDLDVPLEEVGRQQAVTVAERLRALGTPIDVIVTSHLQRTRETAEIIARMLHGVEVVIEPAFAERRLGAWNLCSIAETEIRFIERAKPPGGESDDEFCERIAGAVDNLLPRLPQRPLLVGSKGVARVLGHLLGLPRRPRIANGEMLHFDLSALARPTAMCAA